MRICKCQVSSKAHARKMIENINTPSQSGDWIDVLFDLGAVSDILRADRSMVFGRVMFGKIISPVVLTWMPVDSKLILFNAVLDPVKAHVNCFAALLFDAVVGYTGCY